MAQRRTLIMDTRKQDCENTIYTLVTDLHTPTILLCNICQQLMEKQSIMANNAKYKSNINENMHYEARLSGCDGTSPAGNRQMMGALWSPAARSFHTRIPS